MTKQIDRKGWLGLVTFVVAIAALAAAVVTVVLVEVLS